jgi:site-specific DNA-methyltransferase (adenine-specific)
VPVVVGAMKRDISELLNKIHCCDCLDLMREMPDKIVDLTVTSPPYDNLRSYNGFSFDFENIARELFRIMKDGGVVVWVVGDATINGSETGTSFKQALYFKEVGFNLHDTMIYKKETHIPQNHNRYEQCFEYMFILSKGSPETFNPLVTITKQRTSHPPSKTKSESQVQGGAASGSRTTKTVPFKYTKIRDNIFGYNLGLNMSQSDAIAFLHPATFPEKLASDHILSWSNEGDLVLDPFNGSGTTSKMAKINQRNFIGIDISSEYCEIALKRLEKVNNHKIDEWF